MPESLRTFVAVRIAATRELERVLAALAAFGRPVAAVAPDQLHVTLKFLGATPLEALERIEARIATALRELVRSELRLVGLSAFPRVERPSVVWVGLVGAEPLVQLAARLESELEPLGFAREARPFHPHVTVARVKGRAPGELLEFLGRHAGTQLGVREASEVELIRSDVGREGSHYTTLRAWPLRSS